MKHNKNQGRISGKLGDNAEKRFAKLFREAGWEGAVPMRQISKLKDARKLDIFDIPANCQIKAGIQRKMNLRQVLRSIKEAVSKLPSYCPEHNQHAIVIHTIEPKELSEPSEFDDIVSMTFKDYLQLLRIIHGKEKLKQ